ncbi:MAG: glucosaminidase domain-containing protein [Bradyrhizobium sp.]|nr:glucosaminidase domain-containing protein [Bradyrhizobium sp.]
MTPQQFIAAIAPAAQTSAGQTKIPASFTVAEAALESGWGASLLAQNGFNLFGVKADPSWAGPVLMMETTEYVRGLPVKQMAKWRRYASWLESINDHARFLLDNPRYEPAFEFWHNGILFGREIANCGYATDPAYGDKIAEIITAHSLESLDG